MTAKFTKGPWTITEHMGDYCIDGACGFDVCIVTNDDDIDSYNAALIACAPEMYEQLQEVSNWLNSQLGFGDWHKEIESLLKKARGEA
jgi:hypothetical protein